MHLNSANAIALSYNTNYSELKYSLNINIMLLHIKSF